MSIHIGFQSNNVELRNVYRITGTANGYIDMADTGTYNILIRGNVALGNGERSDIHIKGKDCSWKQLSSVGSSDYVLVGTD